MLREWVPWYCLPKTVLSTKNSSVYQKEGAGAWGATGPFSSFKAGTSYSWGQAPSTLLRFPKPRPMLSVLPFLLSALPPSSRCPPGSPATALLRPLHAYAWCTLGAPLLPYCWLSLSREAFPSRPSSLPLCLSAPAYSTGTRPSVLGRAQVHKLGDWFRAWCRGRAVACPDSEARAVTGAETRVLALPRPVRTLLWHCSGPALALRNPAQPCARTLPCPVGALVWACSGPALLAHRVARVPRAKPFTASSQPSAAPL